MNMATPSQQMINTTTKILNNFLWGSNINKVKHSACISEYNTGGLKMPDVTSIFYTQRIMWLKRFFNSPNSQWKVFFEWQMEKIGGTYARFIQHNNELGSSKIFQTHAIL